MKLLTLFILFSFSSSALSCPNLLGTWVSSKDKSMSYNNLAGLKQNQLDLLNQILGYTTITYTETEVKHHKLPPVKVLYNSNETELTFIEMEIPYKVDSCGKDSISFLTEDNTVSTLNFVDKDTYWVSSKEVLPNSREYFVRNN